MLTLNQLVAKTVNVDVEAYESLLTRGTKPTKALFRLGVEQQLAGILGTLKIATSIEEINEVYANIGVKSCMTGWNVGEFYNFFNISVIYNDRYRCLVNLEKEWKSSRGYGILCYQLDDLLSTVLSKKVREITDFIHSSMELKYTKAAGFHRTLGLPKGILIPFVDDFDQDYDNGKIFHCYSNDSVLSGRAYFQAHQEFEVDVEEDILRNVLDLSPVFEMEILNKEYEDSLISYYLETEILKYGEFKGTTLRGVKVYHYGDWYYFYEAEGLYTKTHEMDIYHIATHNGHLEIQYEDDLPF